MASGETATLVRHDQGSSARRSPEGQLCPQRKLLRREVVYVSSVDGGAITSRSLHARSAGGRLLSDCYGQLLVEASKGGIGVIQRHDEGRPEPRRLELHAAA